MKAVLFRISSLAVVVILLAACGGQATQAPPAQDAIRFLADRTTLQPGECTYLRWEVLAGVGVTLDGEEVPKGGEKEVCLQETGSFTLAVNMGSHVEERVVEISVGGSPMQSQDGEGTVTPGIPAYQAGTWVSTGGPPGGLGYDIRMRPDDPHTMFVTDAHAGVHKSTDGGLTWFPSNTGISLDVFNDVPIFCLTIDPHDYDVIWAGTQLTGHVYRSADNGETWQEWDNGISEEGRSIRGITIDPNNPHVIYVAGEVDLVVWAREMNRSEENGVGGEVYKSVDGGQHWKRIWSGDNLARYVWIDPRDSDRVYVTTGIFDRDAANSTPDNRGGVGILRSDNGGDTWTILNEANGLSGLIIPSLFMHPDNPDTLIASISNFGIGGVFVTYDGGDTWKRAEGGPTHSDSVEIAMSDPDIWYSATEGEISRSDDAGKTWQTYPLATSDRMAGMPIDLQVDPSDPYRIFDNNYGGGNFLSEDGGETWVDASTGYSGAKIGGLLVLPGDGRTVMVGANTGSFRSTNGGDTWLGMTVPSASQFIRHPNGLVVSDSGGNVWHTQDKGATWTKVQVVDLLAEFMAGRMVNDVASMRAFAMAPSDPNVFYVGFHNGVCVTGLAGYCLEPMPNLFRSLDGGWTWEALSGTPFERKAVLSIAVHPQDSQKLYAATIMGLYFSENGGDDWVRVESFDEATRQIPIIDRDNPMVEYDLWVVTDVVFDPFDSQVIYAATQHGGIWRSSDGGQTWQQMAGGMDPNELITKILPDPVHPNLIYAASTLSGVFVTTDGGQSWQSLRDGLTRNNIVNLALSADGSILYAGSDGGGVFRLGGP
jgi:photosystem II stability/assembly factor-like uncharacterized protein